MPRGGSRPGAGRPRKPSALHAILGTWREDRHAHPATAAALIPMATGVADWQPSEADEAALSPRAKDWLAALVSTYALSPVEGRYAVECLRVLSNIEALEAAPGQLAALARERGLFVRMWAALRLEK
jgi:hypothetical protein